MCANADECKSHLLIRRCFHSRAPMSPMRIRQEFLSRASEHDSESSVDSWRRPKKSWYSTASSLVGGRSTWPARCPRFKSKHGLLNSSTVLAMGAGESVVDTGAMSLAQKTDCPNLAPVSGTRKNGDTISSVFQYRPDAVQSNAIGAGLMLVLTLF